MRLSALFVVTGLIVQTAHSQERAWRAEVLLESEHGIGGAAIGDLDPGSPGNEVVAVNAAGEVWMVRRAGDGWRPECIHQGDGELIMCAIGDVDPATPGNELVAVGMVEGPESVSGPGRVLVLRRDGNAWGATHAFVDEHMIHGVAIGDVSTRHPGNEIVACGFNHRVTLLHRAGTGWGHEVVYVGNDRMKIAVIDDVLPDRQGAEALVCGSDGQVVLLYEASLGWRHRVLLADPSGQSRVATGASGVLAGGDHGKVTLITRADDRWSAEVVARDSKKIRGVAIADVDGDGREELFACGYSGNLLMIVPDGEGCWSSEVIYTDVRPLHHLVAGETEAAHPGPELVTCGHSGRVVMLVPPQ
jgi:hypothetical protein